MDNIFIAIIIASVLTLIWICFVIYWWLNEYKRDYLEDSDKVFNDFYSLIKEKDDV